MDHLPSFGVLIYPPTEVPYLCRNDFQAIFQKSNLRGYTVARNFDLNRVDYNNVSITFLQEWAYFAVLAEALQTRGIWLKPLDFSRTRKDHRRILTTYWLSHIISKGRGMLERSSRKKSRKPNAK